MAGVGQSDQPLVSAAVAPTPLVTPANPEILGPNAVSQLVDAFHKGFITQDDIVNRVGDIGQAKDKALLQQLGEYVSPEAIKSRQAQVNLSGAQAEAAQPLIAPQAALAAAEIQRKQADTKWGGGVSMYQQLAPYYDLNPSVMGADGQPDWEEMGRRGSVLSSLYHTQMFGTPDPKQGVTKAFLNGKDVDIQRNGLGLIITPEMQRATGKFAENLHQVVAAMRQHDLTGTNHPLTAALSPRGGTVTETPVAPPPEQGFVPGAAAPVVEPASAPTRQSLLAPRTPPTPVQGASPHTPVNPPEGTTHEDYNYVPTEAEIQAQANVPSVTPIGIPSGPSRIPEWQSKSREQLEKSAPYKQWSANAKFMTQFEDAITMPQSSVSDHDLAYAVNGMLTGAETGLPARQELQRYDHLIEKQPFTDMLSELPQLVNRSYTLSQKTREALIKVGQGVARDLKSGAVSPMRGAVEHFAKTLALNGVPPSVAYPITVLEPGERALYREAMAKATNPKDVLGSQSGGTSHAPAPVARAPVATDNRVKLPDGRRLFKYPDGSFGFTPPKNE